MLRERESHSQLLVYLRFDLNHAAPTYKVGALLLWARLPFLALFPVCFFNEDYSWFWCVLVSCITFRLEWFKREFYSCPRFHVTVHSCFMCADKVGTKFTWIFNKTEYIHINVFLYQMSHWMSTGDVERCFSRLIFWLLCRTFDLKTCHVRAITITE